MPTFMNIELCLHSIQVTFITHGQLNLGSLVTNQNWTQLAWSLRGSTAWLIMWYTCDTHVRNIWLAGTVDKVWCQVLLLSQICRIYSITIRSLVQILDLFYNCLVCFINSTSTYSINAVCSISLLTSYMLYKNQPFSPTNLQCIPVIVVVQTAALNGKTLWLSAWPEVW